MVNEATETQVTKATKVRTSVKMWAAFEKWMAVRGHQTLSGGLRAAIEQVTNFNKECQDKSSPS